MSNNSKKILASFTALCGAIALAACSVGEYAGDASPAYDRTVTGSVTTSPAAAARAISSYRAAHGLGPVRVDASLNRLAARQARAMAASDRVGHDVPGGGSLRARMRSAGVTGYRVVENAGGGERYRSFDAVFAGWRGSPGHNTNLLRPDLTRVGIASVSAPGTRHKVFWVLDMAS